MGEINCLQLTEKFLQVCGRPNRENFVLKNILKPLVFTETVEVEINTVFSCLYLPECSFLSRLFNESLIWKCGRVWYLICFTHFDKSISVAFNTLILERT